MSRKKFIEIKIAKETDLEEILQLQKIAYQSEAEIYNDFNIPPLHQTIEEVKEECKRTLFLKALKNDKIIGSVRAYRDRESCFIGKLIVHPEYQNQGVGGKLINEGFNRLKNWGVDIVFVLGHIEYYPRFGFIKNAEKLGFPAPYTIPDKVADAWMVKSLTSQNINVSKGQVVCADAMNKPKHWRE